MQDAYSNLLMRTNTNAYPCKLIFQTYAHTLQTKKICQNMHKIHHSLSAHPLPGPEVVYLCIIFKCMHSIFGLPGWRHACILKNEGVSHLGLVFWWKDGDDWCRWEGEKSMHLKMIHKYTTRDSNSGPPPQSECKHIAQDRFLWMQIPADILFFILKFNLLLQGFKFTFLLRRV